MILYSFILIIFVLLLATISILLIKRNKKNKFIKLFEHYTIDDDSDYVNEGTDAIPSSDLIGPKGVPQMLPHCNDLKESKRFFPNCCDDKSYKASKCYRLFPKNPVLRLDENGDWIPTNNRNDSKYVYNPLFPYAQTDYTIDPNIPTRLLNKGVKFMNPDSSSWNLNRISSITMPNNKGELVSNTSNNLDILKNYTKLVFFGKDKSSTEPCDVTTGDNCVSIGSNRWQKIGKCPGSNKDMYAYIDVNNFYNPYKTFIPIQSRNGLIESAVQDVFSWIDIPGKFIDTIFGNSSCKLTVDAQNPNGVNQIPYISDPPYDK